MRIERIDQNKIKVFITLSDLRQRNIDIDALTYNSPQAQELFNDLMHQAEEQFGFEAAASQIVVEAIPDSDEGFILTITRLDEPEDFESIHKYIKNRFKKSQLKEKFPGCSLKSKNSIYCFGDFDSLCMSAHAINGIFTGNSTLFKFKNVYYLILSDDGNLTSMSPVENILLEYSVKVSVNSEFYEGYLEEYGKLIYEKKALEMLRFYFN